MKRSLLAIAVTTLSFQVAQAAPFLPLDARGMAMGNTGVASAKRAHAPAYNPSLLSQAREKDDFSLIFPQVGIWVSDEKAIIDEADKINDEIFPRFEDLVTDGNNSLENQIDKLLISIKNAESLNISLNIDNNSDFQAAKTELLNATQQLQDANNRIYSDADEIQKSFTEINSTVTDLTNSLRSISDNPISARLGLSGAVAVPSKKFAVAVSMAGNANISARIHFSQADENLLKAYVPAAQGYVTEAQSASNSINEGLTSLKNTIESAGNISDIVSAKSSFDSSKTELTTAANNLQGYESSSINELGGEPIIRGGRLTEKAQDPALTSTAEIVGVGVVDVGVSFSREFDIQGEKIAVGITPKIQKIYTFHYGNEFDNFDDFDSDVVEEHRKDYTDFNIDIGASYKFGKNGNWVAGAVIKNLLGGSYDYADAKIINKYTLEETTLSGGKVKLNQQVRGGIAYQSKLFNVAFDLDLLKNDPVAYEAATQFASIGGEVDLWGHAQLRAGYRMNLKDSSMKAISAGIGISPGDIFVLDITGVTNPSDFKKESGAILELGLNF